MQAWKWTSLKPVILPGGVLLLAVAILAQSGWLPMPLPALSFLYYCALVGGMLLAWRFHSSRIFLAIVVSFLAQQGLHQFGAHFSNSELSSTGLQIALVLLPLDFILISLVHETGLTFSSIAPFSLFIFVQGVLVGVLCRSAGLPIAHPHPHHIPPSISLPTYPLLAFAMAGTFLLLRSLFTRKPSDSALFWSLTALFLSFRFTGNLTASALYSACAVSILGIAIVETSYLLAYHDELTGLPSRRAFNDALGRLQHPYSIAVVDIDHFKRFNDTYGHDTGDEVLRLVAANLSKVTGGGQAFRCGGEEFAILFSGKPIPEVVAHLEQLRMRVESSEFHMRGADRRQTPRGSDRRNQPTRKGRQKGHRIRQLARENSPAVLSVTVSVGAADSKTYETAAESVLKEADKALYRAKANGRNRVELATPSRPKIKAAGIA